ncbi:hypothetical protein CRYUN_Cryun22dG0065900 [Craigia yunnanensis]
MYHRIGQADSYSYHQSWGISGRICCKFSDVYSKCSYVKDARLIFEEMNKKDIVVWNALFFGYTRQLENEQALKLFSQLQLSRQKPNEFTFAALMTASRNLASLQHGQQYTLS